MFTDEEFVLYCSEKKFSQETITLIDNIRKGQPSRLVQGARGNVTIKYPSKKMGVAIQGESRTVEYGFILHHEFNETTFEYYDQPGQIKISYKAKSGRPVGIKITPDYFILEESGAGWVECKPEKKLITLAADMPNRYIQDEHGNWTSPPAEAYAAQFGLFFRIVTDKNFSWTLINNFEFLDDYFDEGCPPPSTEAAAEITQIVKREPGIMLEDLRLCLKVATVDDVYKLIVAGNLYFDWETQDISKPLWTNIYIDQITAQAYHTIVEAARHADHEATSFVDMVPGEPIDYDGNPYTLLNVGNSFISMTSSNGNLLELNYQNFQQMVRDGKIKSRRVKVSPLSDEVKQIFASVNEDGWNIALKRRAIIKNEQSASSDRTYQRLSKNYRDAELKYGAGNGIIGLLDRRHLPRKRSKRLDEKVETAIREVIEELYENPDQWTKQATYEELRLKLHDQNIEYLCPSYPTFADRINERDQKQQKASRLGEIFANAEEIYHELTMTTPRHGNRAMGLGHLDHTQSDDEVIDPDTGQNLGRPWLTLLVCAYTRLVLAFILTFDPPSYRSNMLVLRECVRRWGRLPSRIVVDGGRDFRSTYFEVLLAKYSITKISRPWRMPHFGSVCERMFGTTNTEFFHRLRGNTKILKKRLRGIPKNLKPKKRGVWNIWDLYEHLGIYLYEIYPLEPHPALRGLTPKDAFDLSMQRSGMRQNRLIPYDDDFIISTFPTTPRGSAKIEPRRGVKINYIYYWSDEMRGHKVENSRVPVRFDPYNIGIAYAFINRRWVLCRSEFFMTLNGHTQKELKILTRIIHEQDKGCRLKKAVTAHRLAELSRVCKDKELLQQQQRDRASKKLLESPSLHHQDSTANGATSNNAVDGFSNSRIDPKDLKIYDPV